MRSMISNSCRQLRSLRGPHTHFCDPVVLEDDHTIAVGQHVQLVGDQHPRPARHEPADALLKDVLAHVRVHRRERVVQQDDVRLQRCAWALCMSYVLE